MAKCKYCGAEVAIGARCTYCGSKAESWIWILWERMILYIVILRI